MQQPATAPRLVEIATLGERLSALRLCDAGALTAMRRSLELHGQLGALTLFVEPGGLEIVDGFSASARRARSAGQRCSPASTRSAPSRPSCASASCTTATG
jgi:hypothetical protein